MRGIYGVKGSYGEKEEYTEFSSISDLCKWLEDNQDKVVFPYVTERFPFKGSEEYVEVLRNYSPFLVFNGPAIRGIYFPDKFMCACGPKFFYIETLDATVEVWPVFCETGVGGFIPWVSCWEAAIEKDKLSKQAVWEIKMQHTCEFSNFLRRQHTTPMFSPAIFDCYDRRALKDAALFERTFNVPYGVFKEWCTAEGAVY